MATHKQVVKAWAMQSGKHCKGFNIFYEGKTIYSYGHHFPLATLIGGMFDKLGMTTVCLINSERYSVSTSKHVSYVAVGAPRHARLFRVPFVLASSHEQHMANHAHLVAEMRDCLARSGRARTYADMYLKWAEKARIDARDYALAFDLI